MQRYIFDESKLDAVIRAAYDLSRPQGLGFLQATQGPLDEEALTNIKALGNSQYAARMDYVHGRAVKLTVRRDGDKLYIDADQWFDHWMSDLQELAVRAGLDGPIEVAGKR